MPKNRSAPPSRRADRRRANRSGARRRRSLEAARPTSPHLERGRRIDAATLRAAMECAFGGSDAEGAWDWKTAYDCLRGGDGSVPAQIRPGHARQGRVTRRHAADAGQDRRAFSRPIRAAPRRARRSSNSRRRSRSVSRPAPPPRSRRPTSCWNPPPGPACSPSSPSSPAARSCSTSWRIPVPGCWTASSRVSPSPASTRRRSMTSRRQRHPQRRADEPAFLGDGPCRSPHGRHRPPPRPLGARRLVDGGRLVAITGANCAPDDPGLDGCVRPTSGARPVVFSAAIDGTVYTKHGTTIDTRLTVIDKQPGDERCKFPHCRDAPNVATLLNWVVRNVPARLPIVGAAAAPAVCRSVVPRTLLGTTVRRSSLPAVCKSRQSPSNSPTRPWIGSRPRATHNRGAL